MSAENNKAVVNYVLTDVCDIEAEKVTKLTSAGYAPNLRRISSATDNTWQRLIEQKMR